MKNRSKKELLRILIEKFERNYSGLCYCANNVYLKGVINVKEWVCLKRLLAKELPKKRNFYGYCWRRGAVSPRIKFLNDLLKKIH